MELNHLRLIITFIFIRLQSFNTVSSEVTQPKAISVNKGHSVTLTIQDNTSQTKQYDDFQWKKDIDDIVVTYISNKSQIQPSYKDKVDFYPDFSLTIKNTQETDGGLYTAKESGDSDIILALYNVTVVSGGSSPGPVFLTWITFLFLLGPVII